MPVIPIPLRRQSGRAAGHSGEGRNPGTSSSSRQPNGSAQQSRAGAEAAERQG